MRTADTFAELFELEPVGDDTFSAISATYPWGQVYGGQVAAQGLLAAGLTVDAAFAPHSLHAYFVRIGTWDEPIIYEVDRIRDGRSFATRRVLARQSKGVILNLSASFQRPEDEPEAQRITLPADVPAPGTIEMDSWISLSLPFLRSSQRFTGTKTGSLATSPCRLAPRQPPFLT